MTDKEIVKRAKDAEKRTGFGELVHSSISKGVNSAYGIGYIEGMVEYRNSLQEEPVSEELEEYSALVADELPQGTALTSNGDFDIASVRKLIIDACKYGAKWQKEQFEKNRLAACDKMTEEEAEIESDFCIGIIESENRQPTFDDAIKYGMRLQTLSCWGISMRILN